MGRWTRIPKGRGRFRRIYVPDPAEKARLRELLPKLYRLWAAAARRTARKRGLPVHNLTDAVHGFVPGRSPVTCAVRHVGMEITASVDLADCFDYVTRDAVLRALSEVSLRPPLWLDELFRDGVAAQGLPTSPMLCNIALLPVDAYMVWLLRGFVRYYAYTRYGDDIAVSSSSSTTDEVRLVLQHLAKLVRSYGFVLNEEKTRIQHASRGMRLICGVSVGPDGIQAPRRVRRLLRAALHRGNTAQASGLAGWCALRMPRRAVLLLAGTELTSCSHRQPCGPDCVSGLDTLKMLRRTLNAAQLVRVIQAARSAHRTNPRLCPGMVIQDALHHTAL
jgi:hypothetical protein